MAAQDLYARQAVPEIGPEEYGLPPLPPAPAPPPTGLSPQEQRRRQLIALSSALAAIIGGPAGRGMASGTLASFEAQDRAIGERDTLLRAEHRQALGQYAIQQQAYQGELTRRQSVYQQNVKALRDLAPAIKTKADMERYFEEFSTGMQQMGLRIDRNRLSEAVRWIAPKARERAQEYIDRWMKRPDAKELLTHPDLLSQIPVEFDWDGDEIPEQGRFLTDVMALADMPIHLTASGQAIVPPTTSNDQVEQVFQELLKEAQADGKDTSSPTLRKDLLLRAETAIAKARRVEPDPRRDQLLDLQLQQAETNLRRGPTPPITILMGPEGPLAVNRQTLQAEPVIGPSGQPVARTPTAQERAARTRVQTARPVLASISELSEKINTQQGILAKMRGGASKIAAQANYNDDVGEYQALIMGFTPLVARALGHVGVLTEQDVRSVRALFPTPGDSKTLRDRKIARIETIIGQLEAQGGSTPIAPETAPAGGPVSPPSTVTIGGQTFQIEVR